MTITNPSGRSGTSTGTDQPTVSDQITVVPDRVVETTDPRTGTPLATVPEHTVPEVRAAVGRARAAFVEWGSLSYRERSDALLAVRDRMLDRAEEIVDTIVAETGKLEGEAVLAELFPLCDLMQYYAHKGERFLREQKVSVGTLAHKTAVKRYEPLGVVGVISPWNYPFTLTMAPLVTALFAGNTVVLKPSEVTPTVGLVIGDLFAGGPYPDIVQVVTGGGATGEALVRSGVQKIVFTGSVRTGKRVMAAASDTLTPVVLELGGKDPMIVCADADLDRAVKGAVWGSFQNSGQTCMSIERVYVVDAVYDSFVDKVVEQTLAIRQGIGDQDIGSMTFAPQVEIVERHLADAEAKGAKVLTGGRRVPDRPGLWFEPTVVVDVDHEMQLMTEETFGPVMPIMKVRNDEEALRLANDSRYGLNSSVWTANPATARRLVDGLEAGNVCVNDCMTSYAISALPFGGTKESGIGRLHGPEGLREFSNIKSVVDSRVSLPREAWWFPMPSYLANAGIRTMRLRYGRSVATKLKGIVPRR